MKTIYSIILLFIGVSSASAQWDLSLSMGLDLKYGPSFRDYVNSSFASGNNQIPSFKSAISFSGEVDYKLSRSFALGLEYDLQIDSYSITYSTGGAYEISYNMQRPSLMAYYVYPGTGYQFKFGGGVGPRFITLTEKINTSADYSSAGYGFVLKAEGNTMLSKNFYALIGTNFRYDISGDVSNSQNSIINRATGENLNLSTISFGIYLGVTFIL
ncbi:MAG: hypothetical protein CVV24_01160 [Ignavibacteriae bacterium HGW-Ignavibacteriae-3]|nr:MAG: hypothetical protein CVV24_01160 [Ignavibacteriae bacterium HGW-Ignavibacteriae-3]